MQIDLYIKVPDQGTSRVHYRVDVPVNGTLQQKCLMKLVMRAHQKLVMRAHQKLEELRPTCVSKIIGNAHFQRRLSSSRRT